MVNRNDLLAVVEKDRSVLYGLIRWATITGKEPKRKTVHSFHSADPIASILA